MRELNTIRNKSVFMVKLALATLLSFGVMIGSVYAEENIITVSHVYVDGEYIGTVKDKSVIQDYIDKKISEKQEKFKNYQLAPSKKVTYVAEQAFAPEYNNEKVLEKIKQEVTIEVKTTALQVNGDTVAYLPTKKAAETALQELKTEYTDNSTQIKLVSNTNEKKDMKPGESVVTDINLSEKVSYSEARIKPEQVMSIEEAVEVLKTGNKEASIHKVKEGETLEEISNYYKLSSEDFMLLKSTLSFGNKLEADQEVKVEQKGPFVDVIVEKEGIREETIEYDKKVVETDELYIGESEVKQEGSDGKKEIRYTKTIVNGEEKETKIIEETIIEEPVKEIILKGTKQKPSRGDGSFVWPAVGGIITSEMGQRWGRMHKGIDISGVSDRTIKAADNGVVSEVSYNDGEYGNRVVIDHNNGYETYYFHLASISVEEGEVVKSGEKIGVMGSTGNSTGMHLHFEVHKNGSVKNPLNYVSK